MCLDNTKSVQLHCFVWPFDIEANQKNDFKIILTVNLFLRSENSVSKPSPSVTGSWGLQLKNTPIALGASPRLNAMAHRPGPKPSPLLSSLLEMPLCKLGFWIGNPQINISSITILWCKRELTQMGENVFAHKIALLLSPCIKINSKNGILFSKRLE